MESRQHKVDILMVGIQQYKKAFVAQFSATFVGLIEPLTGEKHSHAVHRYVTPLVFGHLAALRIQPEDILYVRPFNRSALKKTPSAKHRMPLPQKIGRAHV